MGEAPKPRNGRPGLLNFDSGSRREAAALERVALLGGLVVVMGVVAASGFWLAGRKVWTDGRDLKMPAADANLREVLWTRPQTLGPTFNSDAQEYEPSVSPDGQEVYFVRGKPAQGDGKGETTGADIFVSYRRNNAWTAPVALDEVNTTFDDLGPRLTPDGDFLLFYSDRPGGVGGYDLWAAPRTGSGFGPAFNLGPSVNTEFNEFSPAPTPDGKRLFFATNRKAGYAQQRDAWKATIRQTGLGDYDLFVSDLTARGGPAATQPAATLATRPAPATAPTTAPASQLDPAAAAMLELIGPARRATTQSATAPATRPAATTLAAGPALEVPGVNTMYHEGASCLSPAGDFLYFASNRPGGVGKFDLYRVRIHDGAYGPVENLGREVNTPENEADPQLAMGGFQMYFSSDRAPAPDAIASSYDLLTAESREVYPDRQSRHVPKFGLSAWLLLAALVALIPLLFMLRGWSDGRLNLFQKCLLVSVLLHVLLTILFSAAKVSHEIVVYVKEQRQAEITVTLAEAGGGGAAHDVAQQARQQLTDTAVDVPEPTALPQQAQPAMELPKANDLAQLNIPLARPDAGAMQIQVDAPKAQPAPLPNAPAPQVTVATPEFRPAAPQLDIKPAPRVEAAEAAMQVAPVDAPGARAVQVPAVQLAPQVVQVNVAPAAVQVGPSMAKAVDVAPPTVDTPDVAAAAPSVAAPTVTQGASVTGPKIDTAKVASAAPAAPAASERDLGVSRQATGTATGEAATVQTGVPQASITSGSMASAAAPVGRNLPQEAIEINVKPMVERGGADTIPVRPPTTQPIRKVEQAGPAIAGAEMPTPQVRTAPVAAAADGARAVGLPQTAAAPVKAADVAGGPIATPLMQPATRPAGLGVASIDIASGARPSAATQPATVALDAVAMAAAVGAKGPRVAADGPALPAATETAVAGERQQAAVAAGAALSVQTSAPAVAQLDPSVGANGPAASLAAAAGTSGPRAVDAAVPAPAAQGPRDIAKSGPAVEVAAAGGAMGAKKVNGADATVAAADAPATVVGRTSVSADVAAPEAIRVDPAAAAGAVAGAATAGGSNPSLAAGAGAAPRTMDVAPGVAAVQPGKPIDGAPFALPGSAMIKPLVAGAVGGTSPESTTEAPAAVAGRAEVKTQIAGPERIELAAAPNRAAVVPGALPVVSVAVGATPRMTDASSSALDFEVRVAAPKLSAPPAMFQRSAEQRKPMLEKMGGTKQSEEAVERALAYLARNQEGTGHWTLVRGNRENRKGGKSDTSSHDPALTGLSVLAFLAADHTPTDPGPYQDVVARGIEYLMTIQKPDGDLRGKRPGGGADNGNMYDHGIAAFALAEAALMTGDKRYTKAAFRACDFIVKAQHKKTGGWRYIPGESGDTSVFGWQVMALHSAEQVGYTIPADCRAGMDKYIDIASSGKQRMLGGYQPGGSGTQPMTAELLFCRIMLDHEITPQQEQEVSKFLTRDLPDTRNADFYCWYYGSLSLIQLQNDAWKQWNDRTRETLIAMQTKGGDNDGMFDGNITWKGQGGRIYTTALATLTLEVYYRYLPLRAEAQR